MWRICQIQEKRNHAVKWSRNWISTRNVCAEMQGKAEIVTLCWDWSLHSCTGKVKSALTTFAFKHQFRKHPFKARKIHKVCPILPQPQVSTAWIEPRRFVLLPIPILVWFLFFPILALLNTVSWKELMLLQKCRTPRSAWVAMVITSGIVVLNKTSPYPPSSLLYSVYCCNFWAVQPWIVGY